MDSESAGLDAIGGALVSKLLAEEMPLREPISPPP